MDERITRQDFLRLTGVVVSGALTAGLAEAASTGAARAAPLRPPRLDPAPGARRVCVDTLLSITFDRPPTVGTSGLVRVVGGDGAVVDTIDLDAPTQTRQFGTAPVPFNYFPVIVRGSTASIRLHQQLAYGETYQVVIDPGVLVDADGQSFQAAWQFTTKPSAPPAERPELIVSPHGTGDFCTVQGAIDFVPAGNTRPVRIEVLPGAYDEIVYVGSSRRFITVRGADRDRTVIQYANNNRLNGAVSGRWRVLFGVDASDFTLENLTLHNTTPEGGTQAEAFRGNNTRILLDRVTLRSRQDTILLQNGGLVRDSFIEGDVDFTWGNGGAFFERCEIRSLHRTVSSSTDIVAQVRNTDSTHGNVYLDCRFTAPDMVPTDVAYLARIDPTRFPFSQVVCIGCARDAHIAPAGWRLDNATEAPSVRFWEFGSTDLDGSPLDVSGRAPFSRQLSEAEAARWSDPAFVLGWSPPPPA